MARLVGRGAQTRLVVRVRGLPAIDGAYQVWLYNSVSDAVAVARVVRGRFALEAALPVAFADYRLVDISREPLGGNPNHSGQSLLRASIARLRRAKRSR